jgi:hypothetical protein
MVTIFQVKVERLLGSFEDEVADEEFDEFLLRKVFEAK